MQKIPLIILGGRDRRTASLPEEGKGMHPLHGYKGVDLRVEGQPLIAVVAERMAATGAFGPIFVAGPSRLYEGLVPGLQVIDTDASFGANLQAGVDTVLRELQPPLLAVATCDILPDPAELERAVADLRQHMPLDFWMPQIRVPESEAELGASEWKPRYRLQPPGEREPVPVLPGHLVVANAQALRLGFIYRLFDLFYKTRNTSVARRSFVIFRGMLWSFLREDLEHLFAGRVPYSFATVFYQGLRVTLMIKDGRGTTREIEDRVREIFLERRHRRLHPRLRGRVAILDTMSLARDIDTEEEARELQAAPTDQLASCETASP